MIFNTLIVLVTREEKCLAVILRTRQWQSSVFEWIRQTVPRGDSNTNEWTSSTVALLQDWEGVGWV